MWTAVLSTLMPNSMVEGVMTFLSAIVAVVAVLARGLRG